MKKQRKKVMIITLLLVLIAIVAYFALKTQPSNNNFDDPEQNIATQVITLPDGHHVLAQVEMPIEKEHGWIGATLTDLTSTIRKNLHFIDNNGVYIQDTRLDGPAQVAGILPGDILVKINNVSAYDLMPSLSMIAALEPGNAYPFTIFRQGKYLDYSVTIAKDQYF